MPGHSVAGGMASGLQMGLGLFNAIGSATYRQQLMQNAEENQQMKRQSIALQQQEFAAKRENEARTQDEYVMTHPEAFPVEAQLQATNNMNKRLAGPYARPITQLGKDAFEADLRGFPSKLNSATDRQQQLTLMTEMEAKANENPLFKRAFDMRKPVFQQVMDQQGYYDTARTVFGNLMDENQTRQWVRRTDPKVIAKTFEDKDYQKMFVTRQVEQNLAEFYSGERNFSESALRDTLAMGRAVGMDMGPKGEHILKLHDTYTAYNQSAESLTAIRQKTDALFMAARTTPDVKRLLSTPTPDMSAGKYAHPTPKSPLGPLGFYASEAQAAETSTAEHDTFLQKNPNIAQPLQQLGMEAIDNRTRLTRQMDDLTRQRQLMERDKLNPNRDMYLNIYERQGEAIKRELTAWKPFAEYAENPGLPSLQRVLKAQGGLDKQLKDVSQLRDTALTESDRNARSQTNLQFEKANTVKSTNWTTMKTMQDVAANPTATDEQRLGFATARAEEARKQFGVGPDMNDVTQRIVAQRTKAEDTTVTKLTPEQGFKLETAVTGAENTRSLIQNLFPAGKLDRGALASSIAGGVPFTGGRTIQAYIKDVLDAEYRARTGAVMPESEWDRAQNTFVPGQMDTEQTANTKLTNLLRHFENKLNLVDPDSKLRSRLKPISTVAQVSGKATSTVKGDAGNPDSYAAWKRENPTGTPQQFFDRHQKE